MHRNWTVPLLALCALCPGAALAQASDHCDARHIWAALGPNGHVPSFRGCDPDAVRNALGDSQYTFRIESYDRSNGVQTGQIIRQRTEGNTVLVVVSSGPKGPGVGAILGGVAVD